MNSTQYQVAVGNVAGFEKKKTKKKKKKKKKKKNREKKRYLKKIFASALLKISRRPTVVC